MTRAWGTPRARAVLLLWLGLTALGAWFHAFPAGLLGGAVALALVLAPTFTLLWIVGDNVGEPARWLPAGDPVARSPLGRRDLRVSLFAHWIDEVSGGTAPRAGATDPLRATIRELARDRLRRHHSLALEDAAARDLLGPTAYAYVTTRDPLSPRHARTTLSEILTRIEAL